MRYICDASKKGRATMTTLFKDGFRTISYRYGPFIVTSFGESEPPPLLRAESTPTQ